MAVGGVGGVAVDSGLISPLNDIMFHQNIAPTAPATVGASIPDPSGQVDARFVYITDVGFANGEMAVVFSFPVAWGGDAVVEPAAYF